ncbi:MAG TPA: hypothetical protein VJ124_09460 [Pyrinomonadaceae bacterium]|nr:hypothetical protein [Pyrinomonadaceae bacterium]
MSKKIRRFLGILLACVVTTFALFAHDSKSASTPQGAGVASSATRNAAIVATSMAVLKETSELRELSILRPVKSGAQSRTDIERMIVRNLDEQTTPAEMHATETALKKLGLAPEAFRYRPFIIKLLTEQVAGYYDPKAQNFYLADWIELEGQKPVMAHELTHALQDQHFNLRRFEKWPSGDSDAEMAAHALIEGDATLAMTIYMARNPLVALAFIRSLGATAMASAQFNQAPRALRESLIFPYEQGSEWSTSVYKRGGWKMVSDAFVKLPLSTEQILHPEKYISYEPPVKISLPDIGNLLGRGWRRIDYDVNGEWSYYLILDQFLGAPAESRRAAMGWAGDRYELYEGPLPDQIVIAQLSAWDSENDAREFFDAYTKRTDRRYEGVQVEDGGTSDFHKWQTKEGNVFLERRGERVLILEGLPPGLDWKVINRNLWR